MGLRMLVKQKAHTHTHTHIHRGKICRKATNQQITACPVELYKSSSLVLQPEAKQISFRVHIFSRPLQLYKKIYNLRALVIFVKHIDSSTTQYLILVSSS